MDIRQAVEDAWSKTTRDFEEAKKTGDAWLWTEDTLRLCFFRRFCEKNIKIVRIIAETVFHVGKDDYKPDLVVDIATNGAVETVVFEFKYFKNSKEWEKDWEKLRRYGIIGWECGYFLTIDRSWQSDKIPKESQKEKIPGIPWRSYEIKALVHLTSSLEYMPSFRVAEELLKKSLKGIPYVVSEVFSYAIAFFKGFLICFDMTAKEKKCVVWVRTLNKELWDEGELRNLGYDKWVCFDDEGRIRPAENFTGDILISEFEANTYSNNVRKVKDSLEKFRESIQRLSKQV